MDESSSITIAVRVRPPTQWEKERLPDPEIYEHSYRGDAQLSTPRRITSSTPFKEVVTVMDDKVLVFDKADEIYEQKGYFPPGTKRAKNRRFIFDRVFSPDARQVDVFEDTTRPLLDGLLQGFNATVFAYGATGCGKTHTISGTLEDPGIIYLTMAELFQRIEDKKEDMIVDVHVTFLEIYNEEIRDLLADGSTYAPKGGLAIREDKAVKVVGLTELCPAHADEVKEIVKAGNARRTQSPTLANETSSRSHAVLQIHVTQSPRTAATTEMRTMATLSIIDLAGSERASATKNMGQRMVEGANINKSLLALGNCINALCESGNRTRHIPYRNSKLTRLLKFSLGGNCKTVMIVCVAPTSQHFEDTLNTLQYADRAKMIKTKVSRNLINVDRHVGQYVEAINRLNEEVSELKAKLAGKLGHEAEVAKRKAAEAKAEVERAKTDMQVKADQIREVIVVAATCEGNLRFAQSQLQAIRARLAQIDSQDSDGCLPSDVVAERGLLQAMASAHEGVVRPDSSLRTPIQKAGNANSMFDALLRAVTERRMERLDEARVENIKLDARTRRAEMDRITAEAERDALREAVAKQADLVANLVGILARCTVMMSDGSFLLHSALEGGQTIEACALSVADSLNRVAASNNQAFATLIGHSTAPFVTKGSSLTTFSGHTTTTTTSSRLPTQPAKSKSRRSSLTISATSPIRLYKRNSLALRPSISQPGLLPRPERKFGDKEKKCLRWKDEAGQGDLDDAGLQPNASGATTSSKNVSMGSESEWEDEKTDDSVCLSTAVVAPVTAQDKTLSRRGRSSRIDPNYLKTKRTFALGSLAEDDEPSATRQFSPLTERVNQMPNPDQALAMSFKAKSRLSQQDDNNSPPSQNDIGPRSSVVSRSGRRRSNIGPVRSDKTRRRSSMIPQVSPTLGSTFAKSGGARRILISDSDLSTRKSPAKRVKRLSLLGAPRVSAPRTSVPKAPVSLFDANASMDFGSLRGGLKPTWR